MKSYNADMTVEASSKKKIIIKKKKKKKKVSCAVMAMTEMERRLGYTAPWNRNSALLF